MLIFALIGHQGVRGETRDRAQLLITNPDMLHCSVLPVHRQFSRILAHLRYVIVDEGHAYRCTRATTVIQSYNCLVRTRCCLCR